MNHRTPRNWTWSGLIAAGLLAAGCDDGDTKTVDDVHETGWADIVDRDNDGYFSDEDCDDFDNDVNPGAVEVCDLEDNDCDGVVDENVQSEWYADEDGDGFGDPDNAERGCEAPAGYVPNGNDCDDGDDGIFPGNTEVCNEIDDDCDGDIDEGVTPTWYADDDSDGFGDPLTSWEICTQPTGYVYDDSDCNDDSAQANPESFEVCDGLDNDCDGDTDESDSEDARIWYRDYDGDGHGGSLVISVACDQPEGYFDSVTDCDDSDAAVSPDAVEVCDGDDNDCDSETDEDDASDAQTWYLDADGDSFGDLASSTISCAAPSLYVSDAADCDDLDGDVNPDATELCDGVDNDCDGDVDEPDASDATTWFLDTDADGFGDADDGEVACDAPSGRVDDDTDCDDADGTVNPDAAELCDALDNDCDHEVDEDSAADVRTWYRDYDEDGYGGTLATDVDCEQPPGYVDSATDCDDTDARVSPAATELCNDLDDDCDSTVDEDDAEDAPTWYSDYDGDGYGDGRYHETQCEAPTGYVAPGTDCDDSDDATYPGADELCDGLDNDCDGGLPADEDDADGDGFAECDGDCDDDRSTTNPSAFEVCDGLDNDCDDHVDEADAYDVRTWFMDYDADGYGDSDRTTEACDEPAGYVSDDSDCDDTDAAVSPAEHELCDDDDVDEDCDGLIEDDDDDATGQTPWYADADGDGHGDGADSGVLYCDAPTGRLADDGDCDDGDDSIHPGAQELCDVDDTDEDCDGLADDEDGSAIGQSAWFPDTDLDGYGATAGPSVSYCDEPSGYLADDSDCDDGDPEINPDASEVCDEDDVDEDCDGLVNDDDPEAEGVSWYPDADGDGYGNASSTGIGACVPPDGYTTDNSDCNDLEADVNPGMEEVCDPGDVDEDCNELADDDDPGVAGTTTYHTDADSDGFGSGGDAEWCDAPTGLVTDDTDCDDARADVNPAADEVCDPDDTDEDCDGLADDADDSVVDQGWFYADLDGDGYGGALDTGTLYCDPPSTVVDDNADCDDTDADVNPSAVEVCDADDVDEDCNGVAEDADSGAAGHSTWYADEDGDGYGDETDPGSAWCDPPSDYVADNTDCDDLAPGTNPGATEVCDALDTDEDCNLLADNDDPWATEMSTWYLDADGDGYGDETDGGTELCDPIAHYVADNTDCDDLVAAINPAADEVCDAGDTDEDCDGYADDEDATVTGRITFYDDLDGDGYGDEADPGTAWCDSPSTVVTDHDDCDDTDAGVNPGQAEVCDADDTDENCNGVADDYDAGVTGEVAYYPDGDGDGYGSDSASPVPYCDPPAGFVTDHGDCNDSRSAINPGAVEVCDAGDNDEDCNGVADNYDVDATGRTTYYLDADGDGYGADTDGGTPYCDPPSVYVADRTDCDDLDAAISPAATEVCDADDTDEDCDGLADDADSSVTGTTTYFADADDDGYGDEGATGVPYCDAPTGLVDDDTDCDDADGGINPGAAEICDPADTDEDCDGYADDEDPSTTGETRYYNDADGDGYGSDTGLGADYCDPPTGVVADNSDCDDLVAAISPGASEVCDADDTDEDCDGLADDADPSASGETRWYYDFDEDGYGSSMFRTWACDQPSGYVATAGDCQDLVAAVNPGADEVCDDDDTDEDCDGRADDDDPSVVDPVTYYADADADGYGDEGAAGVDYCDPPSGVVTDNTDCDDADAGANPGAAEVCDADDTDEDCDGVADDYDASVTGETAYYPDGDSDGYGSNSALAVAYCDPPAGFVADHTDCNDSASAVNPGAVEICDAANTDEDCNGVADNYDVDATGAGTWYLDADGDGYGAETDSGTTWCDPPSVYVSDHTDCNDLVATVNPAATEVCDAADTDEDCDGLADDDDSSAAGRTTWYLDGDDDGFGDETDAGAAWCDAPSGVVANHTDCDDSAPGVNPAAAEVCDALDTDEDCDGYADDVDPGVTGTTTYYSDADGDGYGRTTSSGTAFCDAPTGYVDDNSDCNDLAGAVNPGATEVCDAADTDEDCDGLADDADTAASGKTRYYPDGDSDSYGDEDSTGSLYCDAPAGYVSNHTDCNDLAAVVHPGATETWWDGTDQDCAGDNDFDRDRDGEECDSSHGAACTGTDCDDTDALVNSSATDTWYDGTDSDCGGDNDYDADGDGRIPTSYGGADCDDTVATTYAGAPETWYDGVDSDCGGDDDYDADGDGYACDTTHALGCSGGDCDDTDPEINPGATEVWYDGTDQDCDLANDYDADGDGYECDSSHDTGCSGTDCSDNDGTVYPGGPEIRDGQDNNCDDICDEGLLSAGDLIVVEFQKDPATPIADSNGEYFEVYNTTSIDIGICGGWSIYDLDPSAPDSFSVNPVWRFTVPPGGTALFCRNDDETVNGGITTCDYVYGDVFILANTADEIVLEHDGTEIDRVEYLGGSGWPSTAGKAITLDDSAFDGTSNDTASNWCSATTNYYTGGNNGTPNDVNDNCF